LETHLWTVDKIPFTEEGMIEVTTRRVAPTSFDETWRQTIATTPYLSDSDRVAAFGPVPLIKPPGTYQPGFHLLAARRVVAIQGGWWYRGVTCVEPHAEGALVTYTVVNVAPGLGKWLAHFIQAREVRKRARQAPLA
jgi:hypothetical protein